MNDVSALLAQSPVAEAWAKLPAISGAVDPFVVTQRMALYRLLMEASNARGLFGPNNAANIFWGYVFQIHWQWRSGRYQLETDQPADSIHPNSMWGYNNYSLCIIPYLGAVRAGLAPELEIVAAPASARLRYASGGGGRPLIVPPVFAEAVAEWQRFFALIASLRAGDDTEAIRFALWRAHKVSLDAAEVDTPALYPGHSRLEQEFLHGWVRMVDFLGTAAWRTDLDFMLRNGLDVLPERCLTDDDLPGKIADMDAQVNANLRSIFGLVRQSNRRFAFSLWLWRRAMRTRSARDEVLDMLAAHFQPAPENAPARRRLLRYILAL